MELGSLQNTFEPGLLKELEEHAGLMRVSSGEVIMKTGEAIRVIPIVLKGMLKVYRVDETGREILLYYIDTGQSCSMSFSCCMQNRNSEVLAIAEDDTELLAVPVIYMDRWMSDFPSWKNFVMQTIQSRFEELLHVIDEVAFRNLDERLVHYLKERSRVTNSALINLSHEQIAHELATSRVVISRLLKKLENQKKLLLYRNQIKLLREM